MSVKVRKCKRCGSRFRRVSRASGKYCTECWENRKQWYLELLDVAKQGVGRKSDMARQVAIHEVMRCEAALAVEERRKA